MTGKILDVDFKIEMYAMDIGAALRRVRNQASKESIARQKFDNKSRKL